LLSKNNSNMKKISFDFDSTLDRKLVQDFAYSLIKRGYEVWILTSRFEDCDNYNWKITHSYVEDQHNISIYF
jgi:hypothetical protein